jgi:hypothetical protein
MAGKVLLPQQRADWRSERKALLRESENVEKAGAAEGIRTPDPRITNALLYQLSYRGLWALLKRSGGNCHRIAIGHNPVLLIIGARLRKSLP